MKSANMQAKSSSRNVILLSDGTGNSAAKLFKTNVWRTYQALDLSNASQVAFYDDGVGTSSFKPLAVLGGAFGWGLKRNIITLYMFLCRNYAPGDQIFAFGFSRGAFTIRVLIKFVLDQGLVTDFTSHDDLKRKSRKLFRDFRKTESDGFRVSEVVRWLVYLFMGPFEPKDPPTRPMREKIRFLGLWDTVDAYGLPIEEFKTGIDRFVWPLALKDRELHRQVHKACHALAIDDKRMTFHPLLWDETGPSHSHPAEHTDDETLTQVWFAGAHANVGGGYPDDALSHVSLRWMLGEAAKKGLRFSEGALLEYAARTDPFGRLYDSRAGFGAYYRYDPRRLDPPVDKQGAKIPHPKLHESVIWRTAVGTDSYAPLSLPSKLRIVAESDSNDSRRPDLNGRRRNIHDFADYQKLEGRVSEDGADKRPDINIEALQSPKPYAIELMWGTVWWRQVAYFATLIATACLLLFPFLRSDDVSFNSWGWNIARTVSAFDVIAVPWRIIQVLAHILEPLVKLTLEIGVSLLPSLTTPWFRTYLASTWSVALLGVFVAMLLSWGHLIDRRIQDRALAAWNRNWEQHRFEWWRASAELRIVASVIFALLMALTIYQVLARYLKGELSFLECSAAAVDDCLSDREVLRQMGIELPSVVARRFAIASGSIAGVLGFGAVAYAAITYRLVRQSNAERQELPGLALWIASKARRSRALVAARLGFTRVLVPALFALLIIATALVSVSRFSFAVMQGMGFVCRYTRDESVTFALEEKREFSVVDTSNGCSETPFVLELGGHYGIYIVNYTTTGQDGQDAEVEQESFVYPERTPVQDALLRPLLRNVFARRHTPIMLVDSVQPEQVIFQYGGQEIIPLSTGRLFMFPNEPVLGVPYIWNVFYRRSQETWKVTVKRVK